MEEPYGNIIYNILKGGNTSSYINQSEAYRQESIGYLERKRHSQSPGSDIPNHGEIKDDGKEKELQAGSFVKRLTQLHYMIYRQFTATCPRGTPAFRAATTVLLYLSKTVDTRIYPGSGATKSDTASSSYGSQTTWNCGLHRTRRLEPGRIFWHRRINRRIFTSLMHRRT